MSPARGNFGLTFTGSADAGIVAASVGNFANPSDPGLEDFGEILLRGDRAPGLYPRRLVHAGRPRQLGDGRLTILGTDGYLELRKYIDIAGRPGTDHLFLVDNGRPVTSIAAMPTCPIPQT